MKSHFKRLKTGDDRRGFGKQSVANRVNVTGSAVGALVLLLLGACDQGAAPQAATPLPTATSQESPTSTQNPPQNQSIEAGSDQSYSYGTVVSFGRGGAGKRYQVSGWSGTEQVFTWTDKTTAVLAFKISPTESPLVLRMSLEALTGTGLPSQPVRVEANGKEIGNWDVSAKQDFTAIISPEVAKSSDTLTITLYIPKASTPASLGLNSDVRTLGVHCFELEISKQ